MATELTTRRAEGNAIAPPTAVRRLLEPSLMSWTMSAPLPSDAAQHIPAAIAEAKEALAPIEPKALAVMLDEFFANVPMPPAEGLKAWRRILGKYPLDLIQAGLDRCLERHQWETPPKIGQVVQSIEFAHRGRSDWLRKLQSATLRARMDSGRRRPSEPAKLYREKSPQEQAQFDAMMARFRSGGDGVPLFEDERMSASEKELRRAASIRRTQESEHV